MKSTESQIEILAPADCSSSLRNAINNRAESINHGIAQARAAKPQASNGKNQKCRKSMSLFAIMHKRGECNGCGMCAKHAPNYWSMNEKGEAVFCNATSQQGPYDCGSGAMGDAFSLLTAAKNCPLQAIRLF